MKYFKNKKTSFLAAFAGCAFFTAAMIHAPLKAEAFEIDEITHAPSHIVQVQEGGGIFGFFRRDNSGQTPQAAEPIFIPNSNNNSNAGNRYISQPQTRAVAPTARNSNQAFDTPAQAAAKRAAKAEQAVARTMAALDRQRIENDRMNAEIERQQMIEAGLTTPDARAGTGTNMSTTSDGRMMIYRPDRDADARRPVRLFNNVQ